MPIEIAWIPEAREDLMEIAQYIARDSSVHALSVVQNIDTAVQRLADFPRSGHPVPEFKRKRLYEITVYNYRIIYLPTPRRLAVIGIIHGARLLRKALRDRPLT